jgi:hypothetical protein
MNRCKWSHLDYFDARPFLILSRSIRFAIASSPCMLRDRLEAMAKLPRAELYDKFAYHIVLLNDFARQYSATGQALPFNGGSWGRGSGARLATGSASSVRSSGSRRGGLRRHSSLRNNGSTTRGRNSVHGNYVFKTMAAKHREQQQPHRPLVPIVPAAGQTSG